MASASGVEEVVVARRDRRQQVPILTPDDLVRFDVADEPGEGLSGRHVRSLRIAADAAFPHSSVRGLGVVRERLILGNADDEKARPRLWYSVVSGVEDLGSAVIAGGVNLLD
jgi:hypothetical protein